MLKIIRIILKNVIMCQKKNFKGVWSDTDSNLKVLVSVFLTMAILKLCEVSFFLICFLGLTYQLYRVSQHYFSYETNSNIGFHVTEVSRFPTTVFCSRWRDIIVDQKRLYDFTVNTTPPAEKGVKYGRSKVGLFGRGVVLRPKIKDIFDSTPPVTKSIAYCMIRRGDMNIATDLGPSDCYDEYHVSKAVIGELMCYFFSRKSIETFPAGDIADSYYHTNKVHDVTLTKELSVSKVGLFASYFPNVLEDGKLDSFPVVSKQYGVQILRETFINSNFFLSAIQTNVTLLPPPHDTKCSPGHGRQRCYQECLITRMKKINRVPWSSFIPEPLDMEMLLPEDLVNETVADHASQSFRHCHLECKLKTQ